MTNKYAPNSPWTREAIERLKGLWSSHQRSEIVDILNTEFGNRFNGDTVSAKASRIGLKKPFFNKHKADRKSGAVRYHKLSAVEKGFQPVNLLPTVRVIPTKEQIAEDQRLKEQWIAEHGVKVCPPAYFVPRDHDFNRVARSMKGI